MSPTFSACPHQAPTKLQRVGPLSSYLEVLHPYGQSFAHGRDPVDSPTPSDLDAFDYLISNDEDNFIF